MKLRGWWRYADEKNWNFKCENVERQLWWVILWNIWKKTEQFYVLDNCIFICMHVYICIYIKVIGKYSIHKFYIDYIENVLSLSLSLSLIKTHIKGFCTPYTCLFITVGYSYVMHVCIHSQCRMLTRSKGEHVYGIHL